MGANLTDSPARRLPDWPERLTEALDRRRNAIFQWGYHDCASFMVAMVHAMTGRSIWDRSYSTPRESREILRAAGGLRAAIEETAACHGWSVRIEPQSRAQRGDVVLALDENCAECLGVCVGDRVAVAGAIGVVFLPADQVAAAWEIPLEGRDGCPRQ